MLGTLAIDRWHVAFGTPKRGLGAGGDAAQSPRRCISAVAAQCTNFVLGPI